MKNTFLYSDEVVKKTYFLNKSAAVTDLKFLNKMGIFSELHEEVRTEMESVVKKPSVEKLQLKGVSSLTTSRARINLELEDVFRRKIKGENSCRLRLSSSKFHRHYSS